MPTLPLVALLGAPAADAHVPHLELEKWVTQDYSVLDPFVIDTQPEKSRAMYAWLNSPIDRDVYTVEAKAGDVIFAEVIVPTCAAYQDFRPSIAVIGPGLPFPNAIPPILPGFGEGAIVADDSGATPRDEFYEPFGMQSYYQGPRLEGVAPRDGTYTVVVWSPDFAQGDYTAVIGKEEIWGFWDILRALIVTPLLWFDVELHTSC